LLAKLRVKVAANGTDTDRRGSRPARIAAECAYVDERGGVGIRLEAAARDRAAVWRAIPPATATQARAAGTEASSAAVMNAAWIVGVCWMTTWRRTFCPHRI
jgi:hypothetical protein